MIKSKATESGTKKHAGEFHQLTYQSLGLTNLYVSQAGFGCYRVDYRVSEHNDALEKAFLSGVNLIDTSANYTDGNSEKLVGNILNKLINTKQKERESVVIVTKGGYLQGLNYVISQKRKMAGNPFPDLVEYGEGLEHCIHPEFLEDQITRSLQRLNLSTIDIYLLHNPEYFLSFSKSNNIPLEEARKEYYGRIKLAFKHLEREVSRGRIQFYGISSNTFPEIPESYEFTSLEKVLDIAYEVSLKNNFKVIQFPMNLLEAGAAINKNQSDNKTLIELAKDRNLGVLINRPLNAISNNRLIRLDNVEIIKKHLSDTFADFPEQDKLSQLAIRALRSTEGITTVLVGMRRNSYVNDVLSELRIPVEIKKRTEEWRSISEKIHI